MNCSFIALEHCIPCIITRSTNTRAASHLVQPREDAEWEIAPSLAECGQDDGTDQLFQKHTGLMSYDAFGGPFEEDELFARTTQGTDIYAVVFNPTQLESVSKQFQQLPS